MSLKNKTNLFHRVKLIANFLQARLDPDLLVYQLLGTSTFIEVNDLPLVDRDFGSLPRVEKTKTQDDESTLHQVHL